MAKKKKSENTLQHLQMPLPEGRKYSKMTKLSWSGLNYRQTIDTGALSMEKNISTNEAPYLVPSPVPEELDGGYANPIGLYGFDNFLIAIYRDNGAVKLDYIIPDKDESSGYAKYTGIIKSSGADSSDDVPRSLVQFNVYDVPTDILGGKFVKKLLIFPDKMSMDFEIVKSKTISDIKPNLWDADTVAKAETDTIYAYNDGSRVWYYVKNDTDDTTMTPHNNGTGYFAISSLGTMPDIKYATVHLSRVFGVDDDRVYVSGYNDYANWNLDTSDDEDGYNESNAWCSPSQSNTKAGGNFTGITTFQSHVVCFKRDFMHEIYNTKNPFRIQDIYAEGTIDHRTIQDVDGQLIFVSEDEVKIYTGSNPRIISYALNLKQIAYAVSGTDNRCYYLYCEDIYDNRKMYVYDTYIQEWSEREAPYRVHSFAHNQNGMYMLCDTYDENGATYTGGFIYKLDTNSYAHEWSFETDLITNKTVDIKHIKKLQMLADIAPDAKISVYALYDDEVFDKTKSHLLFSYENKGTKVIKKPIRVKPRQTAHYGVKLHFECEGYIKLYELEIFAEAGGDMYV